MTTREATVLRNGIYFVHWIGGGGSVAAVGRDEDGTPWLAPTNWITIGNDRRTVQQIEETWNNVLAVELITTQERELHIRQMERE